MSYTINLTPAPEKKKRRKIYLLFLTVFLALAAGLIWNFAVRLPAREAGEVRTIAAELAPYIRAEGPDPARLERARLLTAGLRPQSRSARNLVEGAEAFWADDFNRAAALLSLVGDKYPDQPLLDSLQAAVNLRHGNVALARDLYQRALTQKTALGAQPLDLAADRLGLALALFMLHQVDEARPLAEAAFQARREALGPDDPDTLSAANRLATILVALRELDEADKILRAAYQGGLRNSQAAAALEETKLLLTVIYSQDDRLEELNEFFAQAPPSAEPARTAEAVPSSVPEPAAKPPAQPAITPETLTAWEKAAAGLAGYNDALAADLRLKIIETRETAEGLGRYGPELRPAVLELVRSLIAAGRYELAAEEIALLPSQSPGREAREVAELSILNLKAQGRLREVEKITQETADQIDARITARVKARKAPDPEDVALSLELHLELADLFLAQDRVPQEAEIELKAALGRLGKNNADNYPDTPRVYLRLARLLWAMGHTRESADFYRRAESVAQALAKKEKQAEVIAALTETSREAKAEAADLAAKKTAPALGPKAQAVAAVPSGELPPPDLLRQELTALSALGRLAEFPERLNPALERAAREFGTSSQNYMRYYSLKLKSLEESGQIDELTRELTAQAETPPGRNEAEKALNRGSALIYAARVNEKAGRDQAATTLYRQALDALSGREEEVISNRRRGVEAELKRLEGK